MVVIRKARLRLVYVLAIIFSGVFAFFGKKAPSWAREAEKEHSAKIFNQEFFQGPQIQDSGTLIAQASDGSTVKRSFTVNDRAFTDRAFTDRAFTIKDRAFTVMPGDRAFTYRDPETITVESFFTSKDQVQSVNQQLADMLQAIQTKIQGGEKLTEGEMALLVQLGSVNK